VEARLRDDARIGILVNNAGATAAGSFVRQGASAITQVVRLNALAVIRLAAAVSPRFVAAGAGAIINIGSVVGLVPELGSTVYGATKAFVLYLSQALHFELGPHGVYVQAVLPAAVRTEIWEHAGKNVDDLPAVMEVAELVDAALVGFDRREAVTIRHCRMKRNGTPSRRRARRCSQTSIRYTQRGGIMPPHRPGSGRRAHQLPKTR
jgi:short-subunit dehydrogenase